MIEQLLVEAPDSDSAISLVDELKDLHSELLPGQGERCQVQVELAGSRERQLETALAAVERWLTDTGLEAARLELGNRTYLLERRPESSAAAAKRAERVGQLTVEAASSDITRSRLRALTRRVSTALIDAPRGRPAEVATGEEPLGR